MPVNKHKLPFHMLEDPLDDGCVGVGMEIRGHVLGTKLTYKNSFI